MDEQQVFLTVLEKTEIAARIALFWALLAVTPLMLLQGLVAAFAGPGAAPDVTGVAVFAVFLWFWLAGLAAGIAAWRAGKGSAGQV